MGAKEEFIGMRSSNGVRAVPVGFDCRLGLVKDGRVLG